MHFHREIRLALATIIAVFAIMVAGAFAADYFVEEGGTGDGSGWGGNALGSIQGAIDKCSGSSPGDTVHVSEGTYYENLTLESYVTMLGGYPAGGGTRDPETYVTIVDGGAVDSVVAIDDKDGVTIDGFTIKNGKPDNGGGIYCNSSSPTITNNTVTANSAGYYGGGICINNYSSPTISNNTITGNSAGYGGGISCLNDSSPTMTNNQITGNSAGWGGGIWCQTDSSPTITNCTIADNKAPYAAGIGIYPWDSPCAPVLLNCILWGDTPDEIAGDTTNLTVSYSDVEGGWAGDGNIEGDPLFSDAENGDYHLLAGSPCIDAADSTGAPELDMEGDTRYDDPNTANTGTGANGDYYDIGALEYQCEIVEATIDIDPHTINLKSKGKYITCYIELPTDYDVNDIDINRVVVSVDGSDVYAETSPTEVGDYDSDSIADLMVKFDRASVQALVSVGSVELEVFGSITGGPDFEGSDVVAVIDKGKEHSDEEDHSSVKQ